MSTWEVYKSELQAKKWRAILKSKYAIDILFTTLKHLKRNNLNINHSSFGRWLYQDNCCRDWLRFLETEKNHSRSSFIETYWRWPRSVRWRCGAGWSQQVCAKTTCKTHQIVSLSQIMYFKILEFYFPYFLLLSITKLNYRVQSLQYGCKVIWNSSLLFYSLVICIKCYLKYNEPFARPCQMCCDSKMLFYNIHSDLILGIFVK